MGRLRTLSGREVCRILADHGFIEVRQRGSHISMRGWAGDSIVTVPIPNHRELAIGTLLSIIRDCAECHGSVLENGEQCRNCGNPLWKYDWLTAE